MATVTISNESGARPFASPPPTASVRVEETAEGHSVTLRPTGAGRWLATAFFALWFAGWSAGEFSVVRYLLTLLGGALGWIPTTGPTGFFAFVIGVILLGCLLVWTIVGAALFMMIARLGWGTDVLTIEPDRWLIWQGIRRWGRTRELNPATIAAIALRRGHGDLIAEADGRVVTLTTYGTTADRDWLRGELAALALGARRSTLDAGTGEESSLTSIAWASSVERRAPSAAKPLLGFQVDSLPDGRARVTTASARRSGQAGFLFFVTLVWNGIVSVFLLAGLGLLRVTYEGPSVAEPGTWGYWLFLLPFCLGGTGIFLGFLWSAFGREEWRVSCDALEVLRAIPGRAWSRVYSAATLTIEIGLDNDLDEIGSLILVAADETRLLKRGEPAAMRALGQFLATETGWELREATSG